MAYLFLALSVGLLVLAIKGLGMVPRVRGVIAAIHAAMATMRSRHLSEEQKEIAVQRAAVEMFRSLGSLSARTLLALAAPLAFVLLGAFLGLYGADDIVRAASDWYFIGASTAFMIGALAVVR